jgi:uncharacterized protein YegP (UPF0339 family)
MAESHPTPQTGSSPGATDARAEGAGPEEPRATAGAASPTAVHFEVYLDAVRGVRWRLRGPDGEILAASRSYPTVEECTAGLESVRAWAATAPFRIDLEVGQ